MLGKNLHRVFLIVLLLSAGAIMTLHAEINFDFGLPLFGHEEIRFEKTKPADFNLQLLKKYLSEQQGTPINQLHAISRWFSLIKLSDVPRRDELVKLSSAFFNNTNKKDVSSERQLQEIFFNGLLLSQDTSPDPENLKDRAYEDLLLEAEDKLAKNAEYSLVKGIVFHLLRNRPNNYFQLMKPEEDLKKALAFIPRTSYHYYVMGQAFRFLGSMDSSLFLSIASYEKASSLDPHNPKLQNSLLGIYMGLHEDYQTRNKPEPFWLEEAVYRKILELSPQNPHALNNLGYLYAEYGVNTQQAQELCQKAVDLAPENPGFHDSLGWAAFKNRDYKKSEEELKQSLSLKMNVYDPHYHLATLYYATGEFDKAIEHYENAIQIRPESAEALNNLAYLYTEENRKIKEAMIMAETAVKLEPSNASYIDTLGWAQYRLGNLDKALATLLKASQLAPGQSEILLHVGRVYLDKNDLDNAITYLREAYKNDQNLKDPDNSLYLAIRLRSYHSALSDYHGIFGDKADKEKINSILMGIARLYQEEKLYNKAIEINKLCAEIKNGERDLKNALLSTYTVSVTPEPQKSTEASAAVLLDEQSPELPAQTNENLFTGLPQETKHPLIVSFGPQFFKWCSNFVEASEHWSDKAVTIFIRKLSKVSRSAVIRIESKSTPGNRLLQLIANYLEQFDAQQITSETPDYMEFKLGKRHLYAAAEGNAVYFSARPFGKAEMPALLNKLCPIASERFMEIIYNWPQLQKLLPGIVRPFVTNPFQPFTRIYTRYSLKDGNLNEFSAATTGREENEDFMKRFARELFAFKLQTLAMGIETTIKVRADKEIIYISTDFEAIHEFIEKRMQRFPFLKKLMNYSLARAICLMNRVLIKPDLSTSCPDGGKIRVDTFSGLIFCSKHANMPAIPLIMDETVSCRYSRSRLYKYIQDNKLLTPENEKSPNFLSDLAKKLKIPVCPSSGAWTLDKDDIKCSEHEN